MLVFDAVSALLAAALLGGVAAWWLSNWRSRRARQISRFGLEAQAALWRHPAGRGRSLSPDGVTAGDPADLPPLRRPTGPDDDPDFLMALERKIRGESGESA